MSARPMRASLVAVALLLSHSARGLHAQADPSDALAALIKSYLALGLPTDWAGIEKLAGSQWGEPAELRNCLPNGDCYARQGRIAVAGRNLTAGATGARTMVNNLMLRNTGAPFGQPTVVAALERAGLGGALARCPVKAGAGTSWYRLQSDGSSGYLSIQPAAGNRGEGFVISQGDELPALQPAQVALYSEQCEPGAARAPVATGKPHEALATTVIVLLVPAGGAALHDWKGLAGLATGITWLGDGPKPMNMSALGDPNPVSQTGEVVLAGRKFSVRASGTPEQVKAIFLDESGLHPRGEHMLGVVHAKGVAVRLVRCGPVYTESTNNWYSLSSAKTRPAHIRQSIRYDGNNVQDAYEIRLDGTLPPRDPRDRNPGVNGC